MGSVTLAWNRAQLGGGIYMSGGSRSATVQGANTHFFFNYAGENGGSLYSASTASDRDSSNDIAFVSCTFSNEASASDGGSLWVSGSQLMVDYTDFLSCHATAGRGGALFMQSYFAADITDTCFFGNTAHAGGGAIFSKNDIADCKLGQLVIYSLNRMVWFDTNTAELGNGGAVHITSAVKCPRHFMTDVYVSSSSTTYGDGAALFLDDQAVLTTTDCWMEGGTAPSGRGNSCAHLCGALLPV
jgi:predicted outer membrane repeat protein